MPAKILIMKKTINGSCIGMYQWFDCHFPGAMVSWGQNVNDCFCFCCYTGMPSIVRIITSGVREGNFSRINEKDEAEK